MKNGSSRNSDKQSFPKSQQKPENSHADAVPDILDDGIFSIKISEDMTIRNTLRSGLFDAQGHDTNKIPLFVSWPHWLDDGIVCLFAEDLHHLLHETIKKTALSIGKVFEMEDDDENYDTPLEDRDKEFEPLSPETMETVSPLDSQNSAAKSRNIVTEIYNEAERVEQEKEQDPKDRLSNGPSD
jgi:hypothetical protein